MSSGNTESNPTEDALEMQLVITYVTPCNMYISSPALSDCSIKRYTCVPLFTASGVDSDFAFCCTLLNRSHK